MPTGVTVRDNESFEQALRRFKRKCEKAGILKARVPFVTAESDPGLRSLFAELAARAGAGTSEFDITEVAMPPYFVPETTTLDDQMRQFLKMRTHFALVVDEYGGMAGLVSATIRT